MRFSAVNIVFVCIGVTSVVYFLYFFLVPIVISGFYLNRHYAASKYEDGFFWVKLNKEDPDYWVYKIDMTGVKIHDIGWYMLYQHKRAYKIYISGLEDNSEPGNN